MTVNWQATARADVVRLVQYIAEENPIAARRMARELVMAGDSLEVFHVVVGLGESQAPANS